MPDLNQGNRVGSGRPLPVRDRRSGAVGHLTAGTAQIRGKILAGLPLLQKRPQQGRDRIGRLPQGHSAQPSGWGRVGSQPSAAEHFKSFGFGVAVFDAGRDQADVGRLVLCAAVMASGYGDPQWFGGRVQREVFQ